MQATGVSLGLPFVWHFGMWGDALIVSPLGAYVVGRFASTVRHRQILVSLSLGIAAAIIMGWSYTLLDVQEAHVQNHSLTPAGIVHLVYMALALAVFTLLFIFTSNVSQRLLRVASVLLVVHVFFGTHMALGLLNLVAPLNWYPAEPLKSIAGWSIIAVVAGGLIWRTLGNRGVFNAIVLVYMFLTSEDPRPPEGYLKFLNRISDLAIATTYFFELFRTELNSGVDRLSLGLLLMIGVKYFFSRVSVMQELEIGKTLYPPGKLPEQLRPKTRVEITIRVLGFLGLYALLGSVFDHVLLASSILLGIACNDYRTRNDIKSNMLPTFDDPRYQPFENERGYQTIVEKRKVARWYLSDLPNRTKEGLCVMGCAAAFGLAVYGYVAHVDLDAAAYTVLIVTLALNELINLVWRIKRFHLLLAIDQRFAVSAG
jgi:hypothetical protein